MRKCFRRQMKMDITLSIRYQAKVNCTATEYHLGSSWMCFNLILLPHSHQSVSGGRYGDTQKNEESSNICLSHHLAEFHPANLEVFKLIFLFSLPDKRPGTRQISSFLAQSRFWHQRWTEKGRKHATWPTLGPGRMFANEITRGTLGTFSDCRYPYQ